MRNFISALEDLGSWRVLALAVVPMGCGPLSGFGADAPPLTTLSVAITGELDAVRVPGATNEALRVALVWGTQWLSERQCLQQPGSPELASVMAAGCRNPFSFTPLRVAASSVIEVGSIAALPILALPAADVMVGPVTGRVAYASLVVFDDRDHSGTLELARPEQVSDHLMGPPDEQDEDLSTADIVYGASLLSMTEPDARLAFREGGFDAAAAFYPRRGCGVPLPAFSIVTAGGFSISDAISAVAAGQLPAEDPASCTESRPEETTISVQLRPPTQVREVGCEQRRFDGSTRYRQPNHTPLDLTRYPFACVAIPGTTLVELVVAGQAGDTCVGLTHFTLRGCDTASDLACTQSRWDFTATPPAWWPCR